MGIWMVRFEPIAVQLSGGQLLTPVQTLVATFIFFRHCERKCKSNPPSHLGNSACILPYFKL